MDVVGIASPFAQPAQFMRGVLFNITSSLLSI